MTIIWRVINNEIIRRLSMMRKIRARHVAKTAPHTSPSVQGRGIPYRTVSGGSHHGSYATYKGMYPGGSRDQTGVKTKGITARTHPGTFRKGGLVGKGSYPKKRLSRADWLRKKKLPPKLGIQKAGIPAGKIGTRYHKRSTKVAQQNLSDRYGVTTYNIDGTVSTIPTATLPDGAPYDPNVMYQFDGEGGYKVVEKGDEF